VARRVAGTSSRSVPITRSSRVKATRGTRRGSLIGPGIPASHGAAYPSAYRNAGGRRLYARHNPFPKTCVGDKIPQSLRAIPPIPAPHMETWRRAPHGPPVPQSHQEPRVVRCHVRCAKRHVRCAVSVTFVAPSSTRCSLRRPQVPFDARKSIQPLVFWARYALPFRADRRTDRDVFAGSAHRP